MPAYRVRHVGHNRRVLVAPSRVVEDYDVVPVVLRPEEDRVVGDAVVVALGHYGPVGVPENVVVDAGVPSRVGSPERAIHPDSVLRHVVYPVVGDSGALLLRLHHLDDGPVRLDVCGVVDLVEHYLGRVPYPDRSRGPCLVHRVVGEPVARTIHHDGRHQALLVGARPVYVVEVGVVDGVVLGARCPSMGLERSPVSIEEVAAVYEAANAVVDPGDVPVVHVLPGMAEGPLRGAGVEESGVPDLRAVAVVEAESRSEVVESLDHHPIVVRAQYGVRLGLHPDVQVVGVTAVPRHVVDCVGRGLMVEEPLSRDVQQLQLLGEEVHVVLVLPLAAGDLLECEGAVARVVGRHVPAPGPERADVQYRYRTRGVHPAVDETVVSGIGSVVVLELPIYVVEAVVLATALVLDHAIVAGRSLVRLVVIHVNASVCPVLVVIESGPVREVRVGPSGRHLLLVVDEELPRFL